MRKPGMTVLQATEIALDALENWHGQYTGDAGEEEDHEGAVVECKCDMGNAARVLAKKLRRAVAK